MTTASELKTSAQEKLEPIFKKHGYHDYTWIDPKNIIVSQWVRMKCMFGCREYGHNACCPPNVPSVSKCEKFFHEYNMAVIFRFGKKVDDPEDRHKWSRQINMKLYKLEKEVFLSGFERAFLLFMDSCCLCEDCTGERETCKEPRSARPSPEAFAVDVFSTVRQYDFPIEVLTDYSREMNRYAFLMVR